MKTVRRYLIPAVCLVALTAIVIGFVVGRRFPAAAPGAARTGAAEEEGLEPMEARRRQLIGRIEEKHQLVRDLQNRRRTLLEVAARFRDLHADEPVYLSRLADRYPNTPEDELHCWGAIDYAAVVLGDRPQEAASLTARLKEELQDLRNAGKVRLPAVGPPPTTPRKLGPARDSAEPAPSR